MSAIIFETRFFRYEINCFFPEMRKVVFLDFEFFVFFFVNNQFENQFTSPFSSNYL